MRLTMLGVRVEPELKKVLQRLAKEERRSVSNFIVNATLIYLKEHKGIDFKGSEEYTPEKA